MTTIVESGPSVSATELEALEKKIGAPFPLSYREFLLSKNGGRPEPDGIEVPGFDETDVQILFGLGRRFESSCIDWNLETLSARLPEQALPIASDSSGNVFYISLTAENHGSVSYADVNAVWGMETTKKAPSYEVASTFEKFIGNLFD